MFGTLREVQYICGTVTSSFALEIHYIYLMERKSSRLMQWYVNKKCK